jgi:RsiW-degrading membrane proteinase PrsW (M82 family)
MTGWITLAIGAVLAGLIIGRAAIRFTRDRSRSPAQQTHRTRVLQGWILLAFGIFVAFAAVATAQSRVLEIVIAAVSIPFAIAILINNRRSAAVGETPAGGKISSP